MDYNGLKHEYETKKCRKCKEVKIIHSFAHDCKDCVRIRNQEKYHGDKFKFNRQPIVAVRPSDKVMVKGKSNKDLRKKLKEEYGVDLNPNSISKSVAKQTNCGINYWYYRGLIVILEKDYTPDNVETIFLNRLRDKQKPNAGRKPKPLTPEMKGKIKEILNLRNVKKLQIENIASRVGLGRSTVSHILLGRQYSDFTGILYQRRYNTYDEEGNVVKAKQKKSKKFYKG